MKYLKQIKIEVYPSNPMPVKLWCPIPKDSYSTFVVNTSDYKYSFGKSKNNIFDILYFEIIPNSEEINIDVIFEFDIKTHVIPNEKFFIEKGLFEEEFVDYSNKEIIQLSERIKADDIEYSVHDYVEKVKEFLTNNLVYESEPKTRIASEVATTLKSDCGGYHSLFCALLRIQKIPALLVFGFDAKKDNSYHTTAYWYDNKIWKRADINAQQDFKGVLQPFLPISIGTNLNIATATTPSFPRDVKFIQHSLVWIEGISPKKVVKSLSILD